MEEAGVRVVEDEVRQGDFHPESGWAAAPRLLRGPPVQLTGDVAVRGAIPARSRRASF